MDIELLAIAAQLFLAGETFTAEQVEVHAYRDRFQLSVLDTLNSHFVNGEALPDYADDSFMAFVMSKPQVDSDRVTVHVFQPLDDGGVVTGEAWLKMKSRAAMLNHDVEEDTDYSRDIQQALLSGEGVPLSAIAVVGKVADGGPAWLKTDVSITITDNNIELVLPMLETPLGVPERFAGHFYIKVLLPNHPMFKNESIKR